MMKSSEFYDNRGRSRQAPSSGRDAAVPLTKGLLDCRRVPDDDFMALWEAIVLDPSLKDRLLSQAVLNFTLRPRGAGAFLPHTREDFLVLLENVLLATVVANLSETLATRP